MVGSTEVGAWLLTNCAFSLMAVMHRFTERPLVANEG
jgi:hypothetical protein